jgi:hypothetical protein
MNAVTKYWWEGRKFKNPTTGKMVNFKSLPLEEQKRLNQQVNKKKEVKAPEKTKSPLEQEVKTSIKTVLNDLNKKFGIEDELSVKVRETSNKKWVAQYRSFSQFKEKPIFWLNKNLSAMMEDLDIPEDKLHDVVYDSIVHEYGHVIAEWARTRNQKMWKVIQDNFEDEEEWAEGFVDVMRSFSDNEHYNKVVKQYQKEVFE